MDNNLKKIEKDLRSFAKRCKDIKYTQILLFVFLLTGLLSLAAPADSVETARRDLNTSITDMKKLFKEAKQENNKLMKGSNLELIQLMEQGDHVVKSPWSSWQYGMNYFYGDWTGTYKGRGDKKEKYPYEGILTRDANAFNRYVSKDSSMYQYLPQSSDPTSASTNSRNGYSLYGLASNKTVSEPPVSFEISASIKPRIVTKGAITVPAPAALEPTLPKAIDFKPVNPVLTPPVINVNIPTLQTPPGTGNDDDSYIIDGGRTRFLAGASNYYTSSQLTVGMIAQANTDSVNNSQKATMNVSVNGSTTDISTKNLKFTSAGGSIAAGNNWTYTNDLNETGYTGYAAMKITGGRKVNIDNTNITLSGNGTTAYRKWLFHIDGHNSGAVGSAFIIGNGSKIDITGNTLVMYTAQYHGNSSRSNIGFINNGEINSTGSDNYIFYTMSAGGNDNRQFYIQNNGKINLSGSGNVLAVINGENAANGGFSFENSSSGNINLSGASQVGIMIMKDYPVGEVLLTKPIEISGNNSVGIAFPAATWLDLAGGQPFAAGNTTEALALPTTSRNSILNFKLSGSNNTGVYFNSTTAKKFNPVEYEIESENGTNNTLVAVFDGEVELGSTKTHKLTITKGSNNTALYTKSSDILKTAADIKIVDSNSSIGIFAENSGTVTNTGSVSATGKSVKAIIADHSTVTSSGAITVNGNSTSDTDGTIGLAAINGGTLTQTGATDITVNDNASIGLYADGGSSKVTVGDSTIKATNGAFNIYSSNSGLVELKGTVDTGQKSLAFYANGGNIKFTGPTTATILGGSDSNTRGTAFLYKGTGYSTITPGTGAPGTGTLGAWANSTFVSTQGNLTLDMKPGSRLFVAQDVEASLSGTNVSGLQSELGINFTPTSTDFKTFMFYLSKINLNQNINLDNATDAYNMLEIANSIIDNNNSNVITGTQPGQVAMAQENDTSYDRNKVQLINNGTITLSGANSTAMYAKFGELKNNATGTITVGDSSAALYGTNDSKIENINGGVINLGNGSTGIYSEGDTAAGITNSSGTFKGSVNNDGIIASTGKSIGITYKGTGAGNTDTRVTNDTNGKINLAGEGSVGIYGLGSNYKILNNGEINLGNSSSLTTNPNVGIYTAVESVKIDNAGTGKITVGNESVGVYGYDVDNARQITAGDNGIGIYSKKLSTGPSTVNHTGTITVGNADATGIFLEDGGNLNFNSGSINVGNNSYGIVAIGSSPFNYTNNAAATVNLGNGSTYFYSNNPTTSFTNNIALNNAAGVGIYGISSPGTVINNANFTLGDQSVGILNTGTGVATNNAAIVVGNSDTGNKNYAIGMATTTGKVINSNTGSITVGADGIGLFADGANSQAENNGTINIAGDRGMGMYLDNGAKGVNNGTITTVGTPTGAVGVVVQHKAELTNNGTITINSPEGYAMFKATGGIIRNHGTINLGNGATETFDPTANPTSKAAGGITINAPTGATPATTTVSTISHGTISSVVSPEHLVINTPQGQAGPSPTSLGIYVDTLGSTNPISGNLGLVTTEADLILGAEAARTTNSRNIVVSGAVLDPYVQMMAANSGVTWNAYGGSLTWMATPLYSNGQLGSVVLAKLPYTEFAGTEATPVNSTDSYNFLHGLDDRYGVEWYGERGAREKELFNKLNDIGKNEEALFYQATDEMMGHQYGNVQQRINETGSLLDKEFKYLRNDWRNPSKQNNKIKVFGMRNEYNTDTAGIIDYTSDAYGVAYVHEDETVKLGNSSGWYAGAVNNRFRFKDIGKSRENQTMLKAGIFKTMSPASDHNGSLRWTIAGDAFISKNEMKRKFLVVDDVFNAKGDYTSYGVALKTDLGYDIRMSERTHLRPYGALKMEYGRFNSIKEDNGEIRLEIEGNDYFSVKPEVGVEFKYVQPLAVRTQLSVGLTAAYENELGRVADGKNKARVRYTDADWFGIRGEKEDRRGSGKFDLNIGVDNTRFGVTFNAGYDTKGSNIRGGLGFRVIY